MIAPTLLAAALQAAAPLPSDPIEADWRPIPAEELMVITLAGDRQVIVRLAPRYAPEHVDNIRRLARARWWDGESVYRVQENWVAQWGDPTEKKPLPAGIVRVPAAEFDAPACDAAQRLKGPDPRAAITGYSADGWPLATDGKAAWLTHCYSMVGVARDKSPDTGTGAELFTPIGQSARRLDRNYTVVGRIVEGMSHLSALPRSGAEMGMYATAGERTPILSVRLASDLPEGDRPRFEYRATDNARFAAALRRREQPAEGMTGPGGLEICESLPPVRRAPAP
jgi:cyclophilin family peptidyl-prolyl cis-trans isomerase